MGALRAAELWPYGMEGVGLVFGMYAQGTLNADDEVAVGHLPSGNHRQLTVPLVNVRWTAWNAVVEDVLTQEHGAELLKSLAVTALHGADLGRDRARGPALSPASGEAAIALRRFAQRHPESSDLKRRDALLALSHSSVSGRPVASARFTPAWMVPKTMYGTYRPAVSGKGSDSASTGERRTPRDLPHTVVRQHLVDTWRVDEPSELEAVARDRGFVSLAEAEDAARRYVLLHRARR